MAKRSLCLALQGGGAHGAFTWGVLDRLLEEDSLELEAVSGTSAGAMNGAVLVDALKRGGPKLARTRLDRFWRSISDAGDSIFKPGRMLPPVLGPNSDWSPMTLWTDMLSLFWSPYDNPFYQNLLINVIDDEIPNFDALNDTRTPYFFACATNVRTNERRIFMPGEHGVAALTASACLPTLFRSVEVDREFYWDGGYLGNPALLPLRSPSLTADLLIVWVNPLNVPSVPTNAREILSRMNEITFNASLVQEVAEIDAVNELKNEFKGKRTRVPSAYKTIRLHEIKNEPALAGLSLASKSNTDWDFLLGLRKIGRDAASRWIKDELKHLGRRSTADVTRMLRRLKS